LRASSNKEGLIKILFDENFSFIESASLKYFYAQRCARA